MPGQDVKALHMVCYLGQRLENVLSTGAIRCWLAQRVGGAALGLVNVYLLQPANCHSTTQTSNEGCSLLMAYGCRQ